MRIKHFEVDPIGKPRMTKADKWKKRPAVERYWAFKDQIALQREDFVFPSRNAIVYFQIKMPDSWSKKKKAKMDFAPHEQTPDLDNLLKALWDALMIEDKQVSKIRAEKYWGKVGRIIIEY